MRRWSAQQSALNGRRRHPRWLVICKNSRCGWPKRLPILPPTIRERHAAYLNASQRADGGYSGREGDSDLYYTGFALRSLAMLGELYGPTADRSAAFLKQRLTAHESVIDLLSLIYGATLLNTAAGIDVWAAAAPNWRDAVAATLEHLRRDDGGYAKGAGRRSQQHLPQLPGVALPPIDRTAAAGPGAIDCFPSLPATRGGGFRELRVSQRAGTNPTAAAIGALRILDALDEDVRQETIQFLAGMQNRGRWVAGQHADPDRRSAEHLHRELDADRSRRSGGHRCTGRLAVC